MYLPFTKHIGRVAMMAAVLLLALPVMAPRAHANQSAFCFNYLNSTATTSKNYMTAGTATSTQTVSNCSDGQTGFEGGAILMSVISSTTPPSLGLRYEVSRDGIDYYPWPFILGGTAGFDGVFVGTTTNQTMLTGANSYNWLAMASSTDMAGTGIASSSAGTAINLRGTTYNQTLVLPATPLPYFRVKYYVPVGAPAIAFSAEILVKREQLAR